MAERACGTKTLQATGPNGQRIAIPMRCNTWGCAICGPRLKKRLIRKFVAGAPDALLTLTCNPAQNHSPYEAFVRMSKAVNTLFKRLRRLFPKHSLQYALVWETTAKGWPHAHLLLRAPYIPHQVLSSYWAELTGAPIVDIRRVTHEGQVARYVAKYLTKAPEVPPGYKRFRTTRNWFTLEPPIKLRELLDCGKFERSAWEWNALKDAWTKQGIPVHVHMDFVLIGYVGPPFQPGAHPEDDTLALPLFPADAAAG